MVGLVVEGAEGDQFLGMGPLRRGDHVGEIYEVLEADGYQRLDIVSSVALVLDWVHAVEVEWVHDFVLADHTGWQAEAED
jgi:hypothetical protein